MYIMKKSRRRQRRPMAARTHFFRTNEIAGKVLSFEKLDPRLSLPRAWYDFEYVELLISRSGSPPSGSSLQMVEKSCRDEESRKLPLRPASDKPGLRFEPDGGNKPDDVDDPVEDCGVVIRLTAAESSAAILLDFISYNFLAH